MSDIILSNSVLSNARGIPQAPSDIVASLKRIDDRLDLLHLRPSEYECEGNPNARGTWAIIINWLPSDPRRARIQCGELDPTAAFDYICAIPFDCPIESARAYFEKAVKGAASIPEARYLLEHCSKWNEKQAVKNSEGAFELGMEILDRNKANPDMADSLGVGTVVTSAGGIEKEPVQPPPPKPKNFVERMLEGKRRKAEQRAVAQ